MSSFDDYQHDMGAHTTLSDEAIEAFLSGRPDASWLGDPALVSLDRELAVSVDRPLPPIGPALARLMHSPETVLAATSETKAVLPSPTPHHRQADGTGTVHRLSDHRRRPRRRVLAAVAGGLALTASLPVAAAAGVLPDPAERAVVAAVEAVTPFEFSDPQSDRPSPRVPTVPPPSVGFETTIDADAVVGGPGSSVPGVGPVRNPATPPVATPGSPGLPAGLPVPADPGLGSAPGADSGAGVSGDTPAGTQAPPFTPPARGAPSSGGPEAQVPESGMDRAGDTPAGAFLPPVSPGPPPGRGA